MAKTALGLGIVLAVLTALAVLGVFSTGMKPGFLAPGVTAADFNLAVEILLVIGLTAGSRGAARSKPIA